ncbi:helix-turn-helix domain-containing protein [Streptomyces himalayensis]|uniref:Helix-turn-helix domain-containing protein n=1 Tax=Streptomyces himalayensis subsp. himalayensis TaxID=2756131 RepID=A0A7W0DTN1_9ACTN|nr:helix-turn-helix transcriptional regulator [Streptomyces himalayensis]MBA2951037.1 helix-turn-helix domain-containing protein [Streptomyces himalayensis subsp. himalayensis]
MAARPRELTPDRSVRDLFGAEVRRCREEAGMSLVRLAEVLNYSKTHLGNVETADRTVPPDLPAKLDAAFDTGGHFGRLYALARREAHPDKYRRYMDLEAQAVSILEYAGHVVPGLLQTKEYARALLRAGAPRATREEIEAKVAARLDRQACLLGEAPPRLSVVLEEAVILRPVGGPAVMHAQLGALLPLMDGPQTVIQVLPFDHGEHFLMGGMQILLELHDGTRIAYVEGGNSGQVIEEYEDVSERWWAYDRLRAHALSPRDSAAMIQSAMQEYASCEPPST